MPRTWTEEQKEEQRQRIVRAQAVKVVMDDARMAKLRQVQAQTFAASEEGRRALALHEEGKDLTRVAVRDVQLRVSTDGTMVSLLGPCICGAEKRQWHPVCLKERG